MLIRRYTTSGAPLTQAPGGEFVLYSDYLNVIGLLGSAKAAPPAELHWQSIYNELAEGLDGAYYYEAKTPFGTAYEMHWHHPGRERLALNDQGEYYNYDDVVAMYPDLDVERDPYWSANYVGTEDEIGFDFPLADFSTARRFCENDYLIRVAACLGVAPPSLSVHTPRPRRLEWYPEPS